MYTAPSLTHFSDSRESRYFDREIRTAPNEKAEFDDYRKERKKKKKTDVHDRLSVPYDTRDRIYTLIYT